MVVYDEHSNSCEIYEIKHSAQRVPEQYRHLVDAEKNSLAESRFGKIAKRCVLYKGESFKEKNGVEYRNVEEYLSAL